jgi:hypothetical protein
VKLNLKIRYFEDVGSGYYVEVVSQQTDFHTRIFYSPKVNDLYKGPIYPSVYICKTEEELDAAIEKAFKRDFGLWGSDEDY